MDDPQFCSPYSIAIGAPMPDLVFQIDSPRVQIHHDLQINLSLSSLTCLFEDSIMNAMMRMDLNFYFAKG